MLPRIRIFSLTFFNIDLFRRSLLFTIISYRELQQSNSFIKEIPVIKSYHNFKTNSVISNFSFYDIFIFYHRLSTYYELVTLVDTTQKKIIKRNTKLQDQNFRILCSDYQYEARFLWVSEPDRQGKNAYDSGEVHDLNEKSQRQTDRIELSKKARKWAYNLIRRRSGVLNKK
jgi:hypothetical protein